ncbi:A-pheromone receptor PreA [Apiospora sp. TS-2023a]
MDSADTSKTMVSFNFSANNTILEYQNDVDKVRTLLVQFRGIKQQELTFVEKAALLSAAAVIGIFSWPDTATSFWLCPTLWYSSLFLSIFALISPSQLRLLEQLPQTTGDAGALNHEEIRRLMLTVVREDRTTERRLEEGNAPTSFKTDPVLTWIWQSPMMLMSYSWVLFLVGYLCYVLTPLIPGSQESMKPVA